MNVLITNDDGIYADGICALYKSFAEKHSVTVVAPDRERSAVGHAITLYSPLRANRVTLESGFQGYAVTGTPADCIKLSVVELLESKPDMVISGINPGANVGINVNYSGTVAAAREAALYNIPAIAVSVQGYMPVDYNGVADFALDAAQKIFTSGLPPGTFLNINFPNIPLSEIAGTKICRQSIEIFPEYMDKRTDPRNRQYYWHICDLNGSGHGAGTDVEALENNYISVTPIKCDATDYDMFENLKNWVEQI